MSDLGRMTDEEIREIFRRILEEGSRLQQPHDVTTLTFLRHLALAVASCTRRDFMILRPTMVVLIAKYHLARYLSDSEAVTAKPGISL
jgi:hypothetical protein